MITNMKDLLSLKAEIEGRPELAPYWNTTFEVEPEPIDIPKPDRSIPHTDKQWTDWQTRQRWLRIKSRFGSLHPDAAYAIVECLRKADQKFNSIVPEDICNAKLAN